MMALVAVVGMLLTPVSQTVDVSLDHSVVTTVRGERFTVESRIRNLGREPTEPLIAYLNVASLTDNVSVDPEDWSPTPNRELAPLAPGASATVSWELRAGDIGTFDLFVVLLPNGPLSAGKGPLVVSSPVHVKASAQNTLTTEGALPVVVAIPLLLGLLALAARLRRGRHA